MENKAGKKIEFILMTFVTSLFIGSMAFASHDSNRDDIKYDYSVALKAKKEADNQNIEKYSKLKNISKEEATNQYYRDLQIQFEKNEEIRNEMIKNNSKG